MKPGNSTTWSKVVNAVEFPLKRALFNCRNCGSCLLSQTHLICPMTCPKGLRNGPCGGTLNGMCEVLPEKPCVWMRIRGSTGEQDPWLLRAPLDPDLLGTPSFLNLFTGADAATRLPLRYPEGKNQAAEPVSDLEKRLHAGEPVITAEIRSPRTEKGLGRVQREVEALLPWVEAFNTTSHAGGHEGLSSFRTAQAVMAAGGEAILQVCGRDVTPEAFLAELVAASAGGIRNVLCLTGDWPAAAPRGGLPAEKARQQFFAMDSSQMIFEARALRERGLSLFGSLGKSSLPAFYIGAAANPYSTPMEAAVSRMAQKAVCGAAFLQTQVVFDVEGFCRWRQALLQNPLTRSLHVLASIPVVGTARAVEGLRQIPGVFVPAEILESLRAAEAQIATTGFELAKKLMTELNEKGVVQGFHLIPFGATPDHLAEAARFGRQLLESSHSRQTLPTP
jgi:methylenetetrahydrofolate reductase (NADPH)